jgi:retinol dehydrogenase-12
MGTNCLAPYLLTLLLEPMLVRTAATAPPLSVRIIFVVSWMHGPGGKGPGPAEGMSFEKDGTPKVLTGMDNYMQSKVGGCWLAAEFAKQVGDKGILSVVGFFFGIRVLNLTICTEFAPRIDED